jgi:tetratricopeptide (TPR) repeat protein
MSGPIALSDQYLAVIDQIVQLTLKGNIRSKEQVYTHLLEAVRPGTGEIFERCLGDRITVAQQQSADSSDELKQAKATRSLRALRTIEGEWERWQAANQAAVVRSLALEEIVTAEPSQRLLKFLQVIDPNRDQPFTATQLQQLASDLKQYPGSDADLQADLTQLAEGILRGLQSWANLQVHLVSWVYDPAQIGFAGMPGTAGNPWAVWAKQAIGALPRSLFHTLAEQGSIDEWATTSTAYTLADWVELAIVLQTVQQGLINWADKLIYSAKTGAKLSISIFLSFVILWAQLANGWQRAAGLNSLHRDRYADGAFRITLQVIRIFAQQDYFPLYGSIFAAFHGGYLQDVVQYLDAPLRQAEGTQEKARILTLLGASERVLGHLDRAEEFHQLAGEIALAAGDQICQIANLNHLSRLYVGQQDYGKAINYSQRALILSRQVGDRLGETNALANLGYSEVFQAQSLEAEPEVYETAIGYLEQGLTLSEKLADPQSQALCGISLGIAQIVLAQPAEALTYLASGFQAAELCGDLYLQAIALANVAEAFYQLKEYDRAITPACLAMYKLEQMGSNAWRQSAGLLTILQGQLEGDFSAQMTAQRAQIIPSIGVDGYDYCWELLDRYRQSA